MCTDNGIIKGQRLCSCPTGRPSKSDGKPAPAKKQGIAEFVREMERKTKVKGAGKKK